VVIVDMGALPVLVMDRSLRLSRAAREASTLGPDFETDRRARVRPMAERLAPPLPERVRSDGPPAPVDAVDRLIVEVLVGEGRLSVTELAARVHISRASAYARLGRLEREGVIRGYSARIDPAKLGLGLAALITLSVDQRSWQQVRRRLNDIPGVVWQALATGAFDHVLLVRVPDVETLRDVVLDRLHAVAEVRSSQTMFLLDEEGDLLTQLGAGGLPVALRPPQPASRRSRASSS
jgi:DNA-binding Lrp family transcriptional regulator